MDPVWIKFLSWLLWLFFFAGQGLLFALLLPFTPRFEPSEFLSYKIFVPAGGLGLISIYFLWVSTRSKRIRHWTFEAREAGKDFNAALKLILRKCLYREFWGLWFATGVSVYAGVLFVWAKIDLTELFLLFVASLALVLLGWPENERALEIARKDWEA